MQNTKTDYLNVLRTWLLALDHNQVLTDIHPDQNLMQEGILDSLEFVNFMLRIEELRGSEIHSKDIQLEKFSTLNLIVAHFFEGLNP